MNDLPTLTELLESRAGNPSPFMIHVGRPVSHAEVLDESRRLASGLVGLGVQPGDRVAIWLPTTPSWMAMFFACARIGAIAVAVNTRFVARELTDIVSRCGAKVLVYWPGFPKVDFAAVIAGCDPGQMPQLRKLVAYSEPGDVERRPAEGWETVPYARLAAQDPMQATAASLESPVLIWTTSGTTKAPKFVLHSQRSLVGHAFDVVPAHNFHQGTVLLLAPPLCGAFGFCLAMAMLVAGRPMVTAPVWDPAQAARWIDEYGVTHMHGVDDAFAQVLDQNDRIPAFPTFEFGGYGNFNPAQKDIVLRAEARGMTVSGMYGTSEIQGLFSLHSLQEDAPTRVFGGGRPASPLVRARARNPDSGAIQPAGVVGELEIHAPTSRMIGYFGNDEATAAAFTEDGFYRTGDLGYVREDGTIFYLGRIGDTLRLGGFLVSPLEIEEVVQELPGVEACQVVDAGTGGQLRAVAFVIHSAETAFDEQAVIEHCRGRLARYKVPARVFALDKFPITEGTNGVKVQKTRLRDLAAQMLKN